MPVAGAPSIVYSLEPTPPAVLKDEVPPLSNGRRYSGWPVHCMPGARVARANGFMSLNGNCMICLLSITRPPEADVVSIRGASAVTEITSAAAPIWSWKSISKRPATFSVKPLRMDFLKPECSTVTE